MRLIDGDALLDELPVHPDGGMRSVKEACLMIRVRETVKNAPTVNGWVSVKDRMPDKIDCYLVALKNHGGIDLDVYHPDINAFNHHRQYVEYWMQIPNLPKEKMYEID